MQIGGQSCRLVPGRPKLQLQEPRVEGVELPQVTAKPGLEMRLVNKLQLVMSSLMLNIKRFALLIPLLLAALPDSA